MTTEATATPKRPPLTMSAEEALPTGRTDHPTAADHDSRICFGISYFTNEADAWRYHEIVREQGLTFNGGYLHGKPCGRDSTWDHFDTETGEARYAVTD